MFTGADWSPHKTIIVVEYIVDIRVVQRIYMSEAEAERTPVSEEGGWGGGGGGGWRPGLRKASRPDLSGRTPGLSGQTTLPRCITTCMQYMTTLVVHEYANQLNSLLVQYSIIKVRCNSKHCVALVHSTLALY